MARNIRWFANRGATMEQCKISFKIFVYAYMMDRGRLNWGRLVAHTFAWLPQVFVYRQIGTEDCLEAPSPTHIMHRGAIHPNKQLWNNATVKMHLSPALFAQCRLDGLNVCEEDQTVQPPCWFEILKDVTNWMALHKAPYGVCP